MLQHFFLTTKHVLDKLHITVSPLVYGLYDSMLQNVYTKRFSLVVLNQLLTCLIQLKSEKAFILLEEMLRVEMKPHTRQYPPIIYHKIITKGCLIVCRFGLMCEIYAEKQKWDECFQFLDYIPFTLFSLRLFIL